ncbi:MAG: class I SAM-dependent methyltransferase [Ornithinimicrobium sp.]
MAAQRMTSWTYAENFSVTSEHVDAATSRAQDLGVATVGAAGGAVLRLLAASCAAGHVIEIGSGTGVSGLWLLEGMADNGVLTSIDMDPERQRAARSAFAAAGVPPQRTRVISGEAHAVLPRMTDGAYDMVFVSADHRGDATYIEQSLRLLRPGGVLAVANILGGDRVADPAARDEETAAIRDLGKALRDDDRLHAALLPVGDGILAAVRR